MSLEERFREDHDVNYKAIMDYYDASTDKPAAAADIIGIPPRRMGGVELRAQVSDFILDLDYNETQEVLDTLGVDPHAESDLQELRAFPHFQQRGDPDLAHHSQSRYPTAVRLANVAQLKEFKRILSDVGEEYNSVMQAVLEEVQLAYEEAYDDLVASVQSARQSNTAQAIGFFKVTLLVGDNREEYPLRMGNNVDGPDYSGYGYIALVKYNGDKYNNINQDGQWASGITLYPVSTPNLQDRADEAIQDGFERGDFTGVTELLPYKELPEYEIVLADVLSIDPTDLYERRKFRLNSILEQVLLESKKDLMKKQYVDTGKLSDKELDRLLGDDRLSDKFAIWLCNRYYNLIKKPYINKTPTGEEAISKEGISIIKRFFEDIGALKTDLATFDRYKNKFTHNDLMKYPDFKSFQDEAIKVSDSLTLADKEKGKEKKEKYAELKIGEVDGFTVYIIPQNRPDLKDAAIDLGSGTRWCTAGSTNNYFTTYNRTDTMFVFVKGTEKYQFHFKDRQFMDKNDHQVPDGPLKTKLLDFVREKAGRLTGKEDMDQYKIGTFETPNGERPLYKVGNKYYTEANKKKIFYDTDTKVFKDISGSTLSLSQLFKADTIPFLKAVYAGMKQDGSTKGFPAVYRLLLGLDVPEKGPEHWWEVPAGLGLRGADLTELPEGLWIHGDLDIRDSQIKSLPERLKVDGETKQ